MIHEDGTRVLPELVVRFFAVQVVPVDGVPEVVGGGGKFECL